MQLGKTKHAHLFKEQTLLSDPKVPVFTYLTMENCKKLNLEKCNRKKNQGRKQWGRKRMCSDQANNRASSQ